MTAFYSPNLTAYVPSMEAVDAAPKEDAPPPKPGERAAAQLVSSAQGIASGYGIGLGYAGALTSSCVAAGRPPVLPGTFATYREMDRDATLGLGIAAADAPVKSVRLSWEAGKNAPGDALDFLRDMLDPMWPLLCREMLTARSMGFYAGEKVFEADAGAVVLRKVRALLPELTTPRYVKGTGAFAGFRNEASRGPDGKGLVLPIEKCLLYTHRKIGDNLYGLSQHENSRMAYSNWLGSIDNGFRAQRKISGVIVQLHYPVGTSTVAGVVTQNSVVAQRILDNLSSANGVALPIDHQAEYAARQVDSEVKPQWLISAVDAGESKALEYIQGDSKYWDTQKLRGWLVPERAVTEGQFGTKAEAEAHGDILLAVSEEVAADLVRTLNWYVIDPLLAWNYGPEAKGMIWATAEPIVDKNRAVLKELLLALMTDPAIRTDIRRQVQLKGALEQFGMSLAEGVNIDEEALEIPNAQERAKAAMQTQQPANGKPPGGNGQTPPNGNGREMRLSRSLAWLDDIAGEDGQGDE